MKRALIVLLACLITACSSEPPVAPVSEQSETAASAWIFQESGTSSSLRGLSVVSDQVAWASGSDGVCLRTVDQGVNWQMLSIPGGESLEFRNIAAIDADMAYLLSAGEPAKLFKTVDGGRSWVEQFSDDTPGIFFDSIAFWDEDHGIAFGDPLEGSFVIIITTDGGANWNRVAAENIPPAQAGEAGFAASGTCISVQGTDRAWIGTGGSVARVLRTTDGGRSWTAASTPMKSGASSTGIFSIAFRDDLNGIIVGGDFQNPDQIEANVAITVDGGLTWKPIEGSPPQGYRSSVAYIPGTDSPTVVTVGPNGADYSVDGGMSWTDLGQEGFHSVGFAGPGVSGWASGADGRLARFAAAKKIDMGN